MRWIAVALGVGVVLAGCDGSPQPSEQTSSSTGQTTAGPEGASPDFDGDGQPDLVAGVGEATGRVTVRYASGRTQDLRPADLQAPHSPGFGRSILARDLNGDGVTDLVIGEPGQTDKPAVLIVPGSPSGLDPAKSHSVAAPAGLVGFGQSLAVVEAPGQVLAVGAPGDGTITAGSATASGGTPASSFIGGAVVLWSLDAAGVPNGDPRVLTLSSDGFPEGAPGDAFGSTLAADAGWLAIGAPRRDVDGARDAGTVFAVDLAASPRKVVQLAEGSDGVPGEARAEDRFGFALAAGGGYLAVAAPLDDQDGRDAGLVQPFRLTAQGPLAEETLLLSALGAQEPAGGLFGISVATARPCAGVPGLVVGAPGVAAGGMTVAGAAWLVALGDASCPARELVEGGALGGAPIEMASLGRAVSAWAEPNGGPDTVVLAAPGNSEEAIPGRVLTLAPPFTGPAATALDGIRLHEEGLLTLSPTD